MAQTRAVIFLPDLAHVYRWGTACHDHCDAHGYTVEGLVVADWAEVVRYTFDGRIHVAVVADRGHLPPNRIPRIEAVTETRPPRPTRRRPEFIQQHEAGPAPLLISPQRLPPHSLE